MRGSWQRCSFFFFSLASSSVFPCEVLMKRLPAPLLFSRYSIVFVNVICAAREKLNILIANIYIYFYPLHHNTMFLL